MKKRKQHVLKCSVGGSIYGKKNGHKVNISGGRKKAKGTKKTTYSDFYKSQLNELYRAIHGK